jgi:hypothetical protein
MIEMRVCNKHGGEPLPITEFAGGSNFRTCKKCRAMLTREIYRRESPIDGGNLSRASELQIKMMTKNWREKNVATN